MELGLGESLLIKAIGQSTGRPLATVKAELKKEGDLGLVALVCARPSRNDVHLLNALSYGRTPRTPSERFSSRKL